VDRHEFRIRGGNGRPEQQAYKGQPHTQNSTRHVSTLIGHKYLLLFLSLVKSLLIIQQEPSLILVLFNLSGKNGKKYCSSSRIQTADTVPVRRRASPSTLAGPAYI
jgi:hypothetical protein